MRYLAFSAIIGAISLLLAIGLPDAGWAAAFNPTDFGSLGSATISGVVTADTDALILDGFTGVLSQGFAVFDFSDFSISSGGDLVAAGSHPLAILSRNNIAIAGELDASAIPELDLVAANNFSLTDSAVLRFNQADVTALSIDIPLGATIIGPASIPEPSSGILLASMLVIGGWWKRTSRLR